jgi:biopolymer transport protein TolQ
LPPAVLLPLSQPAAGPSDLSLVSLLLAASPLVKLVLLLLAGLSVASWGVIFLKSRALRRASQESAEIWDQMEKTGSTLADLRDLAGPLQEAPEASVIRAGLDEWAKVGGAASGATSLDVVRHAVERASAREVIRMERYLNLLATTGSASPFIGLFGTVWGIMNTFRALGFSGSTSLSVVAPGIAEALVATAVGLAAAIPAVMAYNHYVRRIRVLESDLDGFAVAFMDRLAQGRRA